MGADLSNFDKRWSDAHSVSFLFYYYYMQNFKISQIQFAYPSMKKGWIWLFLGYFLVFPFLVHINIKIFLTHDKREKDFVFPPYDGGMAKKKDVLDLNLMK